MQRSVFLDTSKAETSRKYLGLKHRFQEKGEKSTFLHTCDLHLHEDHPQRLEVLRWLLEAAEERGATMLICGDLFDSDQQARVLRPAVRDIFNSHQGVEVFVLPGNHDERSYSGGEDYGRSVRALSAAPLEICEHRGVTLVAAPFAGESNLAAALTDIPAVDGHAILLAHGTYFGGDSSFWREVQERGMEYYPIYPQDIENSTFSYIALGHFHSRFNDFQVGGVTICYPGTPSPVTRAENGTRHAALVTFEPGLRQVSVKLLPVEEGPYYLEERFDLLPGLEENTFLEIDAVLQKNRSDRAEVIIRLTGVTRWTDTQINKEFDNRRRAYSGYYNSLEMVNGATSYSDLMEENALVRDFNEATSYSELVENPLVSDFKERLENKELDENIKRLALSLGLKAFAEAMARRR